MRSFINPSALAAFIVAVGEVMASAWLRSLMLLSVLAHVFRRSCAVGDA